MEYDYIVVGAGSSGATVAGLLAQQTESTVLLLEAGPDYRSSETPMEIRQANSLALQDTTRFGEYWWEPPVRFSALQEPTSYARGRGIGGSSSVNCQVAIRGVPGDYDQWADEGCAGWGFDDVLNSFVRLEHDQDFPTAAFHGSTGPLPIHRPGRNLFGPIDTVLAQSALDLGYQWADDHNSPTASGVSPAAMNSREGVRFSTSDAYLEPARDKGNLTVLGNVLVDRILFSGRKATGLRCRVAGEWTTLSATEIVLSGGALNSPTILLRSGIGPADQLGIYGIDLVRENPAVGHNLSDHPAIFLRVGLGEPTAQDTRDGYPVGCLARFDSNAAGVGANDMGFGSFNYWGAPGEGCAGGSVFVTLFQSFSRGTIALTSSDPDANAAIEFNMLDDCRDLERMADGIRYLLEVGTNAVNSGTAASISLGNDIQSVQDIPQGDALRDWLLRGVGTIGHACGTCRMGSTDDPRSVVDSDCRVIGVENLRVADASIIPCVPRANNHLSCVMVGEHLVAKMLER